MRRGWWIMKRQSIQTSIRSSAGKTWNAPLTACRSEAPHCFASLWSRWCVTSESFVLQGIRSLDCGQNSHLYFFFPLWRRGGGDPLRHFGDKKAISATWPWCWREEWFETGGQSVRTGWPGSLFWRQWQIPLPFSEQEQDKFLLSSSGPVGAVIVYFTLVYKRVFYRTILWPARGEKDDKERKKIGFGVTLRLIVVCADHAASQRQWAGEWQLREPQTSHWQRDGSAPEATKEGMEPHWFESGAKWCTLCPS